MLFFKELKSLAILMLMFLSLQIFGQNITNEKMKYDLNASLKKSAGSEFISEIIEVPIQNPEPVLAFEFNAILTENSDVINFSLRVSADNVIWSEWQQITHSENNYPKSESYSSALYFYNKTTRYIQFQTDEVYKFQELTFSFISPGRSSKKQIKNLSSLPKYGSVQDNERPPYIDRKGWGCPQPENVSSRTLTDVTHLIIHHSAGNTVSNDFAAVVRAYWDYHVNSNGWDDIGYNWLVDPDGVLYKGRAWKSSTEENVMGAHNSGKNGNTAGICLIGNYVSNVPSEEGLNGIADISAFLSQKYGIDPLGESYHAALGTVNDNIDGHGQSGGGTACPGTQVINRLQVIRESTYNKFWDPAASPEILSSYPSSDIDSAYLSKPVIINFSHPMDKQSVESAFSISPNSEGQFNWNDGGNVLSFNPLQPFMSNSIYKVTIKDSAESIWGIKLQNDFELVFITKTYDNLSLLSSYPSDSHMDVPTELTIELRFDGPIDPYSLSGNISFVDIDSNSVSISVDQTGYPDGIISFTPTRALEENSNYFIYLKKGIASTDGYSLKFDSNISFTTELATNVDDIELSNEFNLMNAYPNPFNPVTTIKYSIPGGRNSAFSNIKLIIYDALGNKVRTLVDEKQAAGEYAVKFNAENLASGIYYYSLTADKSSVTKKMLLIK